MSTLFPSPFEETVFWAFVLGFFVNLAVVSRRAGGHKEADETRDKNEARVVGPFFLVLLFAAPIVVGYARIGVLPSYLFYPGLTIAILGAAILDWGMLTLGRFLAPYVRVVSGQYVLQRGPYRFVRHPMYAGGILVWIGLALAVQSWVALLIVMIASSVFYGNRIRIEEKFLAAELGDEYVQYTKRVKRIIPYVV